MNKLWVYGCSFSDDYMSHAIDIAWFNIIADKFNLELASKGVSGVGWRRIKSWIDRDCVKWNENDLIIISPSLFSRIDLPEFYMDEPHGKTGETTEDLLKWIVYTEPIDRIYYYYEEQWRDTVKLLSRLHKNVWTWAWEKSTTSELPHLIPPPLGYESWDNWNKNNKQFWIVPYRHDCTGKGDFIDGDTHFNTDAHNFVANHMLKYIQYENSSIL
jgi:hypothetical protein